MKYYGIKKRKTEGYSVEICGDRRSILFSYGQVEFERTYYKKASGGYEYLADTTVNSLLAFSKKFSYKNLIRTILQAVGLSMMCYKNQKTSPKDKKEYK